MCFYQVRLQLYRIFKKKEKTSSETFASVCLHKLFTALTIWGWFVEFYTKSVNFARLQVASKAWATPAITEQCFHNSKIDFLEWTLKFPGIYCNFLKLKKANVRLLDAGESSQLHNINAFFEINVHGLGVGPSTKWIEIGLLVCERVKRASYKKKIAFSNHKSHIFLHVNICFPYSWISQNFLEFFHFPKVTRKRSGFPRFGKFPSKWKHCNWDKSLVHLPPSSENRHNVCGGPATSTSYRRLEPSRTRSTRSWHAKTGVTSVTRLNGRHRMSLMRSLHR